MQRDENTHKGRRTEGGERSNRMSWPREEKEIGAKDGNSGEDAHICQILERKEKRPTTQRWRSASLPFQQEWPFPFGLMPKSQRACAAVVNVRTACIRPCTLKVLVHILLPLAGAQEGRRARVERGERIHERRRGGAEKKATVARAFRRRRERGRERERERERERLCWPAKMNRSLPRPESAGSDAPGSLYWRIEFEKECVLCMNMYACFGCWWLCCVCFSCAIQQHRHGFAQPAMLVGFGSGANVISAGAGVFILSPSSLPPCPLPAWPQAPGTSARASMQPFQHRLRRRQQQQAWL